MASEAFDSGSNLFQSLIRVAFEYRGQLLLACDLLDQVSPSLLEQPVDGLEVCFFLDDSLVLGLSDGLQFRRLPGDQLFQSR